MRGSKGAQALPRPAPRRNHHAAVEDVLQDPTVRKQRVLELRYGLRGHRAYTLKEVGKIFGLTRERVRQIEKEALRKLRHPQRALMLKAYLN